MRESAPTTQMPPQLAKVPPFPAVALKLLSLLSNDDTGFGSVVACIATDPVLSGKVIKRANAADIASYCDAATVNQAVVALGLDRTREVSLTAATADYAGTAIRRESLQSCWHHTLACALIASELARQCGSRPAEAYTAGLLHDIGRLGLLTAFPEQYEKILAESAAGACDVCEMERTRLGVDHVQAGVWLAREWRLPEALQEVIARQSAPPSGALNDATLVSMACRLADLLGMPAERCPGVKTFEEITAPLPEAARVRLKAQLPAVKDAILAEIGRSGDDEHPAAGKEAEETPASEPDCAATDIPPASPRRWPIWVGALAALMLAAAAIFLHR